MLRSELAQVHQTDFGMAPLPDAAANPFQKEGQDFPLVIATMPATERQRTIAVGIVILLTVAAAVIAPFARLQPAQVDSFIPVFPPGWCVPDLISPFSSLAQFFIPPHP